MSDEEKCVCGHSMDNHGASSDGHTSCVPPCACQDYRFGPNKEPTTCAIDEQQCDAECQARPDRKCAMESTKTESVYERAKRELGRIVREECMRGNYEANYLEITAALEAGEAAEKRAESAERERDEARKVLVELQAAQMQPPTAAEYWGMDYCSKRADHAEHELEKTKKELSEARALLKRVSGPLDPPKEG